MQRRESSGRTKLRVEEGFFSWEISGCSAAFFTDAPQGEDAALHSPPFTVCGKEFELVLYPGGEKETARGRVGLYLVMRTPAALQPLSLSFTFASQTFQFHELVANAEGGKVERWGYPRLLTHTSLLYSSDDFFPGGVLTITALLRSKQFKADSRPLPVAIPAPSISADLSSLLESGEDADVTLLCGAATRMKAHSAILCVRSPVLKAQLKGSLASPRLEAVPVPEEIDAPTLRRTLEFIYTDECEPASAEEAQHLLNSADHYGLARLRAICESKLIETLSNESVAFTLTLAEQHGALALKDAALRFIAANAAAVLRTEGWAHLLLSAPAVVNEVVLAVANGLP